MNIFRVFPKSATFALLIIAITLFFASEYARASSGIGIWWPTDGAVMSGTQPFKALIDGMSLSNYTMYWQVDNGQLNQMSDNNTDSPHKEATVDVSGWHWSGTGAYNINFVAKDSSGKTIAQKQVNIYANKSTVSTQAPQTGSPVAKPIATVSTPPATVSTDPTPQQSAPAVASPAIATETVWWPTDGAVMSGTQPFKALIDGMSLSNYTMYWQVDNGQLNQMSDNNTDSPHKEASVDLSGWSWYGNGPYVINIVAKNQNGTTIASKSMKIYIGSNSTAAAPTPAAASTDPAQSTSVVTAASVTTAPTTATTLSATATTSSTIAIPSTGNPLYSLSFYTDPNNDAAIQAAAWSVSNPTGSNEMKKIATEPTAEWFGDWNTNIYLDSKNFVDAAVASGTTPIMIAYDIVDRDCDGYSSGGATSSVAYETWIKGFASGIGNRKAVIILEPDALSMMDCLSQTDQKTRLSLINFAIEALKANAKNIVYVDAGHSGWIGSSDMASRLSAAGIAKADGFSLNVSNYYSTTDQINYGTAISSLVGNKHFVVDTSRNGLGSNGDEWCNPSGRALGAIPTVNTGNTLADAFLWLKVPGESDGTCNGGPNAGVWWPSYALGLAERASY